MIQWIDDKVKAKKTEELEKLVWAMTKLKKLYPSTILCLNGHRVKSSEKSPDSPYPLPSFDQCNNILNFPIPEEMTDPTYTWFSNQLEKSLERFYEEVSKDQGGAL
jgi:hypothetical protein